MIGYWISFALILLFIPIGLAGIVVWCERKHHFSDAQKKNARANMMKYWLFYWFCDFFYMAWFIESLVCECVFGLIILCSIFINLSIAFSSPKNKTWIERTGMVQDFIIGIGLTIYLIYLIPDVSVQTIVTAIVSSIYGGLITLAGVAWTIRKSDLDRKNDETNKAKPVFSLDQLYMKATDDPLICHFAEKHNSSESQIRLYFRIENSNLSLFTLNRIFHDGRWEKLGGDLVILPSKTIFVDVQVKSLEKVILSVVDILGNEYFYHLNFTDGISNQGEAIISGYKQIILNEMDSIEKRGLDDGTK